QEKSFQTKAQLQRLSNGLQSLDPTIRDTALNSGEHSEIRGMVGVQNPGANAVDNFNSRLQEIAHVAQIDPRRAIAIVSGLPNSVDRTALRSEALLAIARATIENNASAARDALEQLAASLEDLDTPHPNGSLTSCWAEGIEISLQIGDFELAKSLLKSGLEQ